LTKIDAGRLSEFISCQPAGFDKFFKPYSFDEKTFKRLLGNGSYLFIGAFDGDRLVAYCFLRLFVNKSAFRGYIVDSNYQGKGISKQMGKIMTDFAAEIGFRSFATISKENIASLQSQKAGAEVRVVRELPDDYLYVEITKSDSRTSVQ
jgi:RimJ/RimL family protein N-acetyltransferase